MDKHTQEMIELGQKNAKLMPEVKRWCKNIEIKQTTVGLLGQMSNLPIGMLSIECQHGTPCGESMHLDWEAGRYILQNCLNCSFHAEVSPENFGRRMLAEKEQVEQEEMERLNQQRELLQWSYDEAETALLTDEITEASVNALILAVQHPGQDVTVMSDRLKAAASIAPELFTDGALQIMAKGFGQSYGHIYIDAITIIGDKRSNLPVDVLYSAIAAIQNDTNADMACNLVATFFREDLLDPVVAVLPQIIAVADYHPMSMIGQHDSSIEIRNPGALKLIRKLIAAKPEALVKSIEERLKSNDEIERFYAAMLLSALLTENAEYVLRFGPALIGSLELDDPEVNRYAHRSACDLLADLYAYSPKYIEEELSKAWTFALYKVRARLLKVYYQLSREGQLATRGYKSATVFPVEKYTEHIPAAIEKLYNAVGDLSFDAETRVNICADLLYVVQHSPAIALPLLERMIGRLVMTIQEEESIDTNQPDYLKSMEAASHRDYCRGVIWRLRDCIKAIAEDSPHKAYGLVVEAMHGLNSKDKARAKAQLVSVLSAFARHHDLVPNVIPELYSHLVDFESNLVRAAAIRVLGEYLTAIPKQVPDDMLDVLIEIHLPDKYVIIHKAALRAIRGVEFAKNERGYKALSIILSLEKAYHGDSNEVDFLESIVNTLTWSFKSWPEVEKYIATQLLPAYSGHKDVYFAEKMLDRLSRVYHKYPELHAPFVDLVLQYLMRTERDKYNEDHSRSILIQSVSKVHQSIIVSALSLFRSAVLHKIKEDWTESLQLIEMASRLGLHVEVSAIANEVYNSLPDVKANQYRREMLKLVSLAENAEAAYDAGNHTIAMESLLDMQQYLEAKS